MKHKLLQLLWPEVCPFCESISKKGICDSCRRELAKWEIHEPKCMRCGKPIRYEEEELCPDCKRISHAFDQGVSLWLHGGIIKQSIYRFKFQNQRAYKVWYAKEIQKKFQNRIKRWQVDLIVPVPIHKKKKRKRGYNQAELLGKELSLCLNIPWNTGGIVRRKNTKPLKDLQPSERRKNLWDAFYIAPDKRHFFEGKRVLVVDDIYTTGSTMDEMARTLKAAGAIKIYFVTLSSGGN